MKNYSKQYEDVFTSGPSFKHCRIDKISVSDGSNLDEYITQARETTHSFYDMTFSYLVKMVWLYRRFCFDGKRRLQLGRNGIQVDGGFAKFFRHYVGIDTKLITRNDFLSKIITYLDDFFPGFDDGDPFKDDYKYPYKTVALEYLVVVYQMPERLELLQYADDKKMKYTEFLDYMINYVNCYNEEHGTVYDFILSYSFIPYVKVRKKNEGRGTKKEKT